MADFPFCSQNNLNSPLQNLQSFITISPKQNPPMSPSLLFFFFFLAAFFISFSFSLFFLYRTLNRARRPHHDPPPITPSLSQIISDSRHPCENDPTHFPHSLLLDNFPSCSPKWASLFGARPDGTGSGCGEERDGSGGDPQRVKKKKKRARKKKAAVDSKSEGNGGGDGKDLEKESEGSGLDSGQVKQELVCLYPFTSTSSATQRKIKQQYDQLVKCNESKGLTLAQVGEFANCLIEARRELLHKSEVIKRKFTITKALLFKADRSSVDRLRQQIYKLELEQKRLEEDAFVYNWLQQQLKLSPAYKKMLEISACMELKAKSGETIESKDAAEFSEISFEELLAQEKKDSFWQKNGRSRTYAS